VELLSRDEGFLRVVRTTTGTIGSFSISPRDSVVSRPRRGDLYRAEDTNLNRQVAIKVLPDIFAADPVRLARFAREAKPLASLNNPNIAAINTPSFIPR
jgi:hypothetical protein